MPWFDLTSADESTEPQGDYSLNTTVTDNGDGTHTMTLYDHPVKYVDEKGDVQDISLEIASASDGSYKTKANDIQTVFPKKISDGITLSGNGVNVKLTPAAKDTLKDSSAVNSLRTTENISSQQNNGHSERSVSEVEESYSQGSTSVIGEIIADSTVTKLDSETVSYYYDNRTTLEYSLTYTGFKEDIVVSEYTGQTEYHFLLETGGLTLTKIDESYYLTDAEGNIKATLGDIIIFTADERNNALGSMTHTTVREDQQYIVTIHIDADYLKDEKTAYPIRIDPTIEITYDGNGASAIQDVTLNQNSGSSGTSGSLYVGKRNTYGISRTLMKFPGLNLNSIPSNCTIDSAYIEIRDLMCETTAMTVNAAMFMGNDWDESTANWSNTNPNLYSPISGGSVSVSYSNGTAVSPNHRYSINITKAVRLWKSGIYNQTKGIILKADDSVENGSSALYKTFASYNRASLKPSLKINYTSNVTHTAYGWLGFVNSSVINGWVWCSNHPSETLDVVLTITKTGTNQSWRTVGPASIYRSDVKDAGYGTGYYGFSCSMGDWASFPHGYYSVSAVAILPSGGTYTLHASPKTYFNDTLHLDYPEGGGNYLLLGRSMTLRYNYIGNHTVEWSSSDRTVASVVKASGIITAKEEGTAVITATLTDLSTNKIYTSSLPLYVRKNVGIANNSAYYIMNYSNRQYLSVSGTNVCTVSRAPIAANQWTLTMQEDEKYNLRSGASSTNNILNVNGSNLVISSNSSSTNLIGTEDFTLYRAIDEGYEGLYCIRYQNYYVTKDVDGITLTDEPMNGSFWSLMKVAKGTADVISFEYLENETTLFNSGVNDAEFEEAFETLGYNARVNSNITPNNAFNLLQTSDVFCYIGHGAPGALCFRTNTGEPNGYIYSHMSSSLIDPCISSLANNALASSRCVLYLGCETGCTTTNGTAGNLVDIAYEKGAHFALGITIVVNHGDIQTFAYELYNAFATGNSIEWCIDRALLMTGENVDYNNGQFGEMPLHKIGDTSQILN